MGDRWATYALSLPDRRLDGDYLTLLSLLRPSSSDHPSPIGAPVSVESRFDRFRPLRKGGWREEKGWEEGGGVLWDLGAHLVDQGELEVSNISTTFSDVVSTSFSRMVRMKPYTE